MRATGKSDIDCWQPISKIFSYVFITIKMAFIFKSQFLYIAMQNGHREPQSIYQLINIYNTQAKRHVSYTSLIISYTKEGYVLSKYSKYSKTLKRLKRLAPKVPDYTCPDIDFIVDKVENNNKGFTKFRKKLLVRKLERLRIQNEALRESGEYWYKKLKNYLFDLI